MIAVEMHHTNNNKILYKDIFRLFLVTLSSFLTLWIVYIYLHYFTFQTKYTTHVKIIFPKQQAKNLTPGYWRYESLFIIKFKYKYIYTIICSGPSKWNYIELCFGHCMQIERLSVVWCYNKQ